MRAQAVEENRISAVYAAAHEIVFSEFVAYKNGDFGVRNVLHDDRIIELLRQRYGWSISKDTLTRAKKKLARVLGFRWDRTPAGCTYRMHADGTMSGKYPLAKCDMECEANPHPTSQKCGLRKTITKKIAANETEVSTNTVHSGRTGTRPPPRGWRSERLAALAAWEPAAADIEFGMRLHLTDREIQAEAERMRRWYVHPDHPERQAWAPADPSAKFREWLERGATKKAIRKAEKEAAELRRQAAENDLRAAAMERARAARGAREMEHENGEDGDDADGDAFDIEVIVKCSIAAASFDHVDKHAPDRDAGYAAYAAWEAAEMETRDQHMRQRHERNGLWDAAQRDYWRDDEGIPF